VGAFLEGVARRVVVAEEEEEETRGLTSMRTVVVWESMIFAG
jgi:hypothetical protein